MGKLTYLLVFAVTGGGVYQWGAASAKRSSPAGCYTATARIYQRADSSAGADMAESAAAREAQLDGIQPQILSDESLSGVLRTAGLVTAGLPGEEQESAVKRASDQLRGELRIAAMETSSSDELGISLSYTSSRPRYAVRVVNALAQRYATGYHKRWKERTRRAYVEVREISDRAQRESMEADARLDTFFEAHFNRSDPAAGRAVPGSSPEGDRTPTDADRPRPLAGWEPVPTPGPVLDPQRSPPKPSLKDNPDWIVLSERLAVLRRRQSELLIDRTPYHPQVRDNKIHIETVKQQLAEIPRKLPAEPSDVPSPKVEAPAAPPRLPPARTAQQYAAAVEEFRRLKAVADGASQVYEQASRSEREAWFEYQQEPPIKLELAQPIEIPTPRNLALELILAALTAGMAMTAGMGMICSGAAMEPTIGSVAEARAVLPVPVVGAIPESGFTGEDRPVLRWQRLMQIGTMAGGVALIAGCAALLLRAFGN